METKIKECQTLKELSVLGSQSVLNEMEQRLVFERQMEIFQRIMEWRLENEQLGLAPDLTDTWKPEQREAFLRDWFDDQVILQTNHGEKRSHEEIMKEPQPHKRVMARKDLMMRCWMVMNLSKSVVAKMMKDRLTSKASRK